MLVAIMLVAIMLVAITLVAITLVAITLRAVPDHGPWHCGRTVLRAHSTAGAQY
jgi:hypothetical protein